MAEEHCEPRVQIDEDLSNSTMGGDHSLGKFPEKANTDASSLLSEEEDREIAHAFSSSSSLKAEEEETEHKAWTDNSEAKHQLFAMLTCAYLLILVIIGFLLEMSHIMNKKGTHINVEGAKDLLFSLYMYGGSLGFLVYVYTVLLRNQFVRWGLQKEKTRSKLNLFMKGVKTLLKVDVDAKLEDGDDEPEGPKKYQPPTGGLFLRLGCVVFGLFGIVYCGLVMVLCICDYKSEDKSCSNYTVGTTGLAMLFMFVQMHFVFCNSSIVVHGSLQIARLGLMHMVATNMWTWLRYILLEEEVTTIELEHANFSFSVHDVLSELHKTDHQHHVEVAHPHECQGLECALGSATEFMYTCIVEYSLICATVCFVFWTNTGREISAFHKKRVLMHNVIAIDCSRTTTGLFFGFIIVAFTCICITVFNTYIHDHDNKHIAYKIFFSTTLAFLIVSLGGVIFAFYRMKDLNFKMEEEDIDESAELLDRILLVFGLTGELIFCIGGIMSLSQAPALQGMVLLLFATKWLSLIQVLTQSALLLIGSKLKASSPRLRKKKPGKQVVTFLLVANIALLIMNTFEAQSAGVSEDIVRLYGSKSWALLVRGCAPLTIFFRFHSAACFAEIWKHSYSAVKGDLELY